MYDHTKSLIYIGKSYHLWKRILSSCLERRALYCSYTIIGNKADTDIYEMYYISKLKPLENGTGKTDDSPTIILPELEFFPLTQVYILSDEKNRVNGTPGRHHIMIIRVIKNNDNPYVMMNKYCLQDKKPIMESQGIIGLSFISPR